jgi:hypothetical protein
VLPGYLHHSTCSIGVTLFGKMPTSVSELLKQADLAMYQAKAAGRNTVRFFDPEMQALASANATLASTCARPGARTTVRVDYQPQVGPTARMVGVEALLRWEHPQRGMVPPEQSSRPPRKPRSSSRSATGCWSTPARSWRVGARRTGATWRSRSTSACASSATRSSSTT